MVSYYTIEIVKNVSKDIIFLTKLREKCPNTEFFQVRIFPYLNWRRRDTLCLSVFSLNAGKYGPEKTPYLETFHAALNKRFFFENFFYK